MSSEILPEAEGQPLMWREKVDFNYMLGRYMYKICKAIFIINQRQRHGCIKSALFPLLLPFSFHSLIRSSCLVFSSCGSMAEASDTKDASLKRSPSQTRVAMEDAPMTRLVGQEDPKNWSSGRKCATNSLKVRTKESD